MSGDVSIEGRKVKSSPSAPSAAAVAATASLPTEKRMKEKGDQPRYVVPPDRGWSEGSPAAPVSIAAADTVAVALTASPVADDERGGERQRETVS